MVTSNSNTSASPVFLKYLTRLLTFSNTTLYHLILIPQYPILYRNTSMSQIAITATVNEQVLQKRFSFHLPALHPAISIGEVASAAEQTEPLNSYPTLILTSPSPPTHPISSMMSDGELHLEWQAPRGETAAALERTQNQLDRLQNDFDRLQNDFDSVRGALFCAVLPRTDKLAIRCLLDVFLAKEGYSLQSCGPRRAWVTANKATISQVTGIPEGNVDRLFQCASLSIYFSYFFLITLTPEPTGMRVMRAPTHSLQTPLRMGSCVSRTLSTETIYVRSSPRLSL